MINSFPLMLSGVSLYNYCYGRSCSKCSFCRIQYGNKTCESYQCMMHVCKVYADFCVEHLSCDGCNLNKDDSTCYAHTLSVNLCLHKFTDKVCA